MSKRNVTTVRQIGGALGVIIPIQFLRAQKMQRGDELHVRVFGEDTLILVKINTIT